MSGSKMESIMDADEMHVSDSKIAPANVAFFISVYLSSSSTESELYQAGSFESMSLSECSCLLILSI